MPIVEAVGVVAGFNNDRSERNKAIEAAMTQAVISAQAEGITDPDEIRARILAARDSITEG